MDFAKLPVGFAMALAQNEAAMIKFGAMTQPQRQTILAQARNARSEQEMTQIVSGISHAQ